VPSDTPWERTWTDKPPSTIGDTHPKKKKEYKSRNTQGTLKVRCETGDRHRMTGVLHRRRYCSRDLAACGQTVGILTGNHELHPGLSCTSKYYSATRFPCISSPRAGKKRIWSGTNEFKFFVLRQIEQRLAQTRANLYQRILNRCGLAAADKLISISCGTAAELFTK